MKKRSRFFYYFLVFFVLSFVIFAADKIGILKPLNNLLQNTFSPIQTSVYSFFSNLTGESAQVTALKTENANLIKRLIDQNKLASDNKALMDQFQSQKSSNPFLLPAGIVGAPGFIPGISSPDVFILNKGSGDGVDVGDGVIYNNNLIGRVNKVTPSFSEVMLITNSQMSFTAETLDTKSMGVVKGQGGGQIILDNVLLSVNLKKGDIVVTKGDVNTQGIGFAPGLIVGKILSISKNPSDLFQKAEIKSDVDFSSLSTVFIQTRLQ